MTHFHRYLTFILVAVGAVMAAHGYSDLISVSDLPEIDDEKITNNFLNSNENGAQPLNELEAFFSPLIGSDILCFMYRDSLLNSLNGYDQLVTAKDIAEKMIENIEYINHPGVRYLRLKTAGLRPVYDYLAQSYRALGFSNKSDSVFAVMERKMREDFGVESEDYLFWILKSAHIMTSKDAGFTKALDLMNPGIEVVYSNDSLPQSLSFEFLLEYARNSNHAGQNEQALKYAGEAVARASEPEQIYDSSTLYAQLLGQAGRFEEADEYFQKASKNCYELSQFLMNSYAFSSVLIQTGNYQKAFDLLNELGQRYLDDPSLSPLDKFLYYETLGVASTYVDLAISDTAFQEAEKYIDYVSRELVLKHILNSQVYRHADNSFEVISSLDRAIFIYSIFMEDNPRILAELLYLKGYYYNQINDYEKALRFLNEALKQSMNLGYSDPLLQRISSEIADCAKHFPESGMRRDAVEVLLRLSSHLPDDSSQRLAAIAEAIDFYLDIEDIENVRKYLGIYFNHRPNGVDTRHFAVRLALITKEYDKARKLIESLEEEPHKEKMEIDRLWEEFYSKQSMPEVVEFARKNFENYREKLAKRLLFMSSAERHNVSGEVAELRDKAVTLVSKVPEMAEVALDYSLLLKGLLYTTESQVNLYLKGESSAQAGLDTLKRWRTLLNRAESQGAAEICDYLRNGIASRERYIINDFVDFNKFKNSLLKRSLREIKQTIPEDAAYVDLVGIRDGKYYVAFVIDGKTKDVSCIPIASKHKLRRMPYGVWVVLDSVVKGKKDIYFSTDGILSSIPLEFLVDDDHNPYSDRYRLHRVFHLADIHSGVKIEGNALVIGVADHNSPIGKASTINRGSWTDIDKVEDEMGIIKDKWNPNHLRILFNDEARESILKRLDKSNIKLLHISTHGFYRDNDSLLVAAVSPKHVDHNVAMRALNVGKESLSGLVLRQGNLSWKSPEILDEEDDLLTAEEIEMLEFPNLQLTVLSACDTGLGTTDGEGVWGLQRAFRIAGTKNLICTLSEVNDYWSAQFMELFYDQAAKGESIYDAFHYAQKTLREENPDNPEIWGSFVLIE